MGREAATRRDDPRRPAGGGRGSAHASRGPTAVAGAGLPARLDRLDPGVGWPQWGKSDETGVAVGRDLVIVIDLSRSMQAPDMADPSAPTRWQAARAGALDLLAGIARRGGHRVAVVVFAAHPESDLPADDRLRPCARRDR